MIKKILKILDKFVVWLHEHIYLPIMKVSSHKYQCMSNEEAFEYDRKKIEEDWAVVMKDLEDVFSILSVPPELFECGKDKG